MKKGVLFRGLIVLSLIWSLVWGVTAWTGSRKATPDKIDAMIKASNFDDLSAGDSLSLSEAERDSRRKRMNEISGVLNQLDLQQRKKLEANGRMVDFFLKLSGEEKLQFIDLTFTKSAGRLMESFDQMDAEDRRKMIMRSVEDMAGGKGAAALARLKEEDPEVVQLVIEKGFQAYYQDASADTKMALRPFLDAVGEVIQGFANPAGGGL